MTDDYKIDMLYGNGQIDQNNIQTICGNLGITLPLSYIKLIQHNDAGCPNKSFFDYFDIMYLEILTASLGRFLSYISKTYDNILILNQNPPEFFPEGLIAFAEDGGGNLICFDYRKGKDNPNPPIVFWNHEADIGKDVSFIANSFDEFLSMLKSEEEIDALLNEKESS